MARPEKLKGDALEKVENRRNEFEQMKKIRKENKWVSHVKSRASELHGGNYRKALLDPETKSSYRAAAAATQE